MLDAKKIINAISRARFAKKNNKLSPELLKATREDFWDSEKESESRKKELLDMAKTKQKRPVKRTSVLGNVLCHYTNPESPSYDAEFTEQIKVVAPHWFSKSSDRSKNELLDLAKSGAPKPHYKNKMYSKLTEYINEGRSSYDADFTAQIKKIAPHWFADTSTIKKQEILKMARSGQKRPNQRKHPLGYTLDSYCKASSNSYDPEFVVELKKLAPHWFRS